MIPFTVYTACWTLKMTNKRCVTEKVKTCICTICFGMCVVYVFWYVKHKTYKKKTKQNKTDQPTLFFSMLTLWDP